MMAGWLDTEGVCEALSEGVCEALALTEGVCEALALTEGVCEALALTLAEGVVEAETLGVPLGLCGEGEADALHETDGDIVDDAELAGQETDCCAAFLEYAQ